MVKDTTAVPTTDKDLEIPFLKETILNSITDRVLWNVLIKPKETILVATTDNNLLVVFANEITETSVADKVLKKPLIKVATETPTTDKILK